MAITNNINYYFAVVGVRAAGFVARQSPTTLILPLLVFVPLALWHGNHQQH